MKKLLPLLLLAFLIFSCKSKKTKLTDEDTVEISDFIGFFPEVNLPYRLTDSTMLKKENDSILIGYKTFARFLPDTVLSWQFSKKIKPKIYPLGRVVVKKAETYLFVKAITPAKRAAYILVFDNEQKFVTAKPIIISDEDPSTLQTAEMDKKYSLTTVYQKKPVNKQPVYRKDVYVFNSAGVFMLILKESNDSNKIVNPIDVLPRKNKLKKKKRQ